MPANHLAKPIDGAVERLLKRLQYEFADPTLLQTALRHASVLRELGGVVGESYERLEFLGDAVVQLVISELLYREQPDASEGDLTRLRSALVRGSSLAVVGAELGLGEALTVTRAAERGGARLRRSVLACAFEAVLGAVFIDGGFDAARTVALHLLQPHLRAAAQSVHNPKGELQEYTQEHFRSGPEYALLEVVGRPHQRRFRVEVRLEQRVLASGEGSSKQAAEEAAATAALAALRADEATSAR